LPVKERYLVLMVDRDNDLGLKTGIVTPVMGRENCIETAKALILADPEEADANAVFFAVKCFDELKAKGRDVEVAIVAGSRDEVEADLKIRKEVSQLVSDLGVEGLILVSDGVEDEKIIPVVQPTAPIVSVKRVVIRHSARIEESYILFWKYLKMLVSDPRYSKVFIGYPGLVALAAGLLFLLNLHREALSFSVFLAGIILIIKGFSLDVAMRKIFHLRFADYIALFSWISLLVTTAGAVAWSYSYLIEMPEFRMATADPELFLKYVPKLMGILMERAVSILWLGIGIFLLGGMLRNYLLRRYVELLRFMMLLLIVALLYLPLVEFSRILRDPVISPLSAISLLLFGLALTFLTITLLYGWLSDRMVRRIVTRPP